MVAGFVMSGLYTNSAEERQKMSFSHSFHFGQKTMTGAYIPCAYQQGLVHDAPLLLGDGGGRGPITSYPFLSCLPYPLPPRPVFSQVHTSYPPPLSFNEKKNKIYLLHQFPQRGFWLMATGKQPRQSFLDYKPFLHSTVGYLFEIQIRLFKNPKWHNFPLLCYVFTCEIYLSSSCLKKV